MSTAELSHSFMNFSERGDSGLYLALSIPASLPAAGFRGANRSRPAPQQEKANSPATTSRLLPHKFKPFLLSTHSQPTLQPARAWCVPTTSSSPPTVGPAPQYPQTKPTRLQLQKGQSPYAQGEPDIHIFLLIYIQFPGGTVQIYIRDQILVLRSFLDDCTCHFPRDYQLMLRPPDTYSH